MDEVLAGKYRVEQVIAKGGMGVVVAARHLQLDERVAIKFLRDEWLNDPDVVARFAREARTAIKIKSEHVARVIDVGALPTGAPYMVMEYLEGEDLGKWLRSRGALPLDQAVEFVLQTCEAIAEAHALGIVHRDLKPANLFVIRRMDGLLAIKVLDFGISKVASHHDALGGKTSDRITRSGVALGSPCYMSPEQLTGTAVVDARADIWALGISFFEMLTGVVPFDGDATVQLYGRILRDPPPSLRERCPDIPQKVEAVVAKCLEKDPAQRYQNIGELALALAPFAPPRALGSADRIWRTAQAAGLASLPPAVDFAQSNPRLEEEKVDPRTGTRGAWGRSAKARSLVRRHGALAAGGVLGVGIALALWSYRMSFVSEPEAVAPIPAATAIATVDAPFEPPAAQPAASTEVTGAPAASASANGEPRRPAPPARAAAISSSTPAARAAAAGAAASSSRPPHPAAPVTPIKTGKAAPRAEGAAAPARPAARSPVYDERN